MNLHSRYTSSNEAVDENGDVAMPSVSDSSNEDFFANIIEIVEDSDDSNVEVRDGKGNMSDVDTVSSASKKRIVGMKNEKECSNSKTLVHNVAEAVKVDGSNGQVTEVNNLASVYIEYLNPIMTTKNNKKGKNEDRPTLMWEVWEEEQERWTNEHMAKEVDLENQNAVVSETADAPSDLVMPLLKYQKEWLAWALKQEESVSRGGILADEMGMGKTVQAISLVLAKRELRRAIGEPYGLSTLSCSLKGLPVVKGTLVICPLVAVIQWVGEIERFTTKGSNKILVYHGAKRGKTVQQFSEYDFVITTYSTVEAEYRKNLMPPKQKCQWCGKLYYERRMALHLKYYCGPDAVKTFKQSKQRKKRTENFEKTTEQKEPVAKDGESESRGPKGKTGHKKNVEMDKAGINVDIGSTSQSPAGNSVDSLVDKSILHSVKWDRMILDEAHYIKDRRCNTTRAILALESSYKWALSGTPLQNRVGELYSLVRFLQIVPYSYYLCKDCDCRTLDYSSSKDCPNCPHKAVRHFCWWNRNVATPIQHHGNSDAGRRAMFLLKQKLLNSILLRRTKKGRAADLALPPRIVTLRKDTLDIKEEDYYTSLYSESQSQFNTYIEAGTLMNNYAHIFDLLTRLRQLDAETKVLSSSANKNTPSSGETGIHRKGNEVDNTCADLQGSTTMRA